MNQPVPFRRMEYRPDREEFIRTPEAARMLGIRTRAVFELIDAGVLRLAVDEKGLPRVPVADVEAYLRRRSA